MEEEINQMLEKGAIIKLDPSPDQFLSKIFTVLEKDRGNRPVINLKKLNNFIHCPCFKIKGLLLLRELFSPDDWMCKVDLKSAYFSFYTYPLELTKELTLWMERFSLSVPLALFRVIPSLLVFMKLLKVPIVLLRKLKVGLIIYPDDILLMVSKEELEKGRDTLIFFIQHLSFVINAKKVCPRFDKNHRIPWDYNDIVLNCPGSPPSSSHVSLPTETTNRRMKNCPFQRKTHYLLKAEQRFSGGLTIWT